MKPILLSLFAFLFTTAIFAQDNIVLRTGEEIKAKVEEVGLSEIKYKKTDNPTGPLYTIRKDEVLLINYANGGKDVFPQVPSGWNNMMRSRDNFPGAVATSGDYNKYRKLGIKGIVGGAIMLGVGVPTLAAGIGITASGLDGGDYFFNSNTGMWDKKTDYQTLAAGGFFTAAGIVLTVLGPISIKKGLHFRRMAKEMRPASMGFTPINNPALDRYNHAMNQNKVGLTLTF